MRRNLAMKVIDQQRRQRALDAELEVAIAAGMRDWEQSTGATLTPDERLIFRSAFGRGALFANERATEFIREELDK